jgi:hypothetical protein
MKQMLRQAKFITSFANFFCFETRQLDDSAFKMARELWGRNQKFYSVDFIPQWFSMFVCHLGDEQ